MPGKTINFDEIVGDVVSAPKDNKEAGDVFSREGYAWAIDCYWVAEHLGEKMTKAKAGSSLRYQLLKFANANTEQFFGTLMPRAMGLLEKAREKSGDSDKVEIDERKSIAELQRTLAAAIHEVEKLS